MFKNIYIYVPSCHSVIFCVFTVNVMSMAFKVSFSVG